MQSTTERAAPGLEFERELWAAGYRMLAGLDEVGRGAWAGPVVAAAVIMPANASLLEPLLGQVNDSKCLSPAARERLYEPICAVALAVGIGSVPAQEIDRIGILPATRLAMLQALACLNLPPDHLILDYLTLPDVHQMQLSLPHGDARCFSVAAASILAKVTRDRWMCGQETHHKGYGFVRHKGYGTAEHRAALAELGPCALHRLSFSPLKFALQPLALANGNSHEPEPAAEA